MSHTIFLRPARLLRLLMDCFNKLRGSRGIRVPQGLRSCCVITMIARSTSPTGTSLGFEVFEWFNWSSPITSSTDSCWPIWIRSWGIGSTWNSVGFGMCQGIPFLWRLPITYADMLGACSKSNFWEFLTCKFPFSPDTQFLSVRFLVSNLFLCVFFISHAEHDCPYRLASIYQAYFSVLVNTAVKRLFWHFLRNLIVLACPPYLATRVSYGSIHDTRAGWVYVYQAITVQSANQGKSL